MRILKPEEMTDAQIALGRMIEDSSDESIYEIILDSRTNETRILYGTRFSDLKIYRQSTLTSLIRARMERLNANNSSISS